MKYYSGTTDFASDSPSAVTLGKFDGMHRGHQKLFQRGPQSGRAEPDSLYDRSG